VTEAPAPGQGDIKVNPRPAPKASRIREVAAVTTVPARIAAQDTADRFASQVTGSVVGE
jgi:hypothetical protein